MALSDWTFRIKLLNGGNYTSQGSYGQGGSRQSVQSIKQSYLVTAIPPDGETSIGSHDDTNDPDLMNEHYVGCISGLPTVMGSVYYDENTGVINPYAICMSKSVTRDTQNPYLYRVECTFKTKSLETENCTVLSSSVNSATDISPEVTVQVGGTNRVLYQDLATGDQCFMYDGIKERFSSPVTTDVPNLTLNISQYETAVSYAQILQRSYVTNNAIYAGFGAGMWLCKVSNVSNVAVQTNVGVQTWARVTYDVTLSQDGYFDTSGSFQLTGHKHQVPLIAGKYVDNGDEEDSKEFVYEKTGLPKMGMINANGTKATNQDVPDYLTFTKYRSTSFSFLQV
jgi:hypothetical protein